jgi:hypothetical protein
MTRLLRYACALLFAGSPALFGWGREGHAIIADIAAKHLSDRARRQVAVLLGENVTLASIASWGDEVRPQRPETSTWHYINIPIAGAKKEWADYCPSSGCLPKAIEQMSATLRSPAASREQKAEALKFLVHFVGDLHQPLHVGERGDRGGNDVPAMLNGRPWNLHSAWDTGILMAALQRDPSLGSRLRKGPGWWSRLGMRRGVLSGWVAETVSVSAKSVYPDVGADRPAELGEAYQAASMRVIGMQLQRGGVRLAKELNWLLDD